MKREKTISYESCDFCDSVDEAAGRCDICGMHYCPNHGSNYPWGDQMYMFCNEHYELVNEIIQYTGIPMGFITRKLRGEELPVFLLDMWNERGYEGRWNAYVEQKK